MASPPSITCAPQYVKFLMGDIKGTGSVAFRDDLGGLCRLSTGICNSRSLRSLVPDSSSDSKSVLSPRRGSLDVRQTVSYDINICAGCRTDPIQTLSPK